MKHILPILAVAAGFLAASQPRLRAQPAYTQPTNTLKIYTAIEIEYPTQIGQTYTLQGAVNLTNWTDIGNPVLGTGRTVDRIYSTKNGGTVAYAAYRLRVADGPTNGFAPWSMTGVTVQMYDSSATNVAQYVDDTNGQDIYNGADDPFTYVYSRLSENDAQSDRTFTPDRHETITYSYTGPGIGTWVREEYRLGLLERRELGVFRYLAYGTNYLTAMTNAPVVSTNTLPPAPPNLLTGLVYYVRSGSLPDQYTFQTTNAGYETATTALSGQHSSEGVTGNAYTYTYNVLSSNTASLIINFGYYGFGGDRQEYDLTYTDGPSGLFNRRIYRLGSLSTTDNGAFSPYAVPPKAGGTNAPPLDTNTPPVNPVGLTFTMLTGEVPPRLVFQTTVSGIEYDDSAPTDFTFTYDATGTNTYHLVVRFKPDRWDDYNLTFNTGAQGTFVRRQYRNSALNRTDAGPFSVTVTGN